MIKSAIKVYPKAIHMDFEKAVMNACVLLFKCHIFGCFFHLSQNFFRKLSENVENWITKLSTGTIYKTKATSVEHTRILKFIVESYDKDDILGYLKKISLIL